MTEKRDNPSVIAPPPLIALATVLLGLAMDWLMPAFVLTVLLPFEVRMLLGGLFLAGGIALAVIAREVFVHAGTALNPYKPSSVLATSGVYAHLRNPMYVGLGFIVGGIAIAAASDWTLVLLVVAALTIHFGVVRREEAYLEGKFGDAYRHYIASVPRYGWPPPRW